jgi:hypothetical protein
MCHSRGHSFRDLRHSRRCTHACGQDVSARVLLAHYHVRRRLLSPSLRMLLILCLTETCVVISAPDHTITCPFSRWGMDLVGPFKKAKGEFTHILVDKFTKWIEVKPAVSITAAKAVEFIREIMYWFDAPNNIVTDNETQFTTREFKDFCIYSSIMINYTSLSHP